MGQLVSHTSKKATETNRRKEFSCSCRELSSKAHGVDAIVVSTNTHSIGSDCHGCLFRVTKKLRVIIDDITLLVPSKECFM